MTGRRTAQPIYPQLRKYPCVPELTLRANSDMNSSTWTITKPHAVLEGAMRKLLVAFVCIVGVMSPAAAAEPPCLLLMTAGSGKVVLQQGAECVTQNSPASTFKIALAAMGYDAGILEDEHTPAWPYKEEYAAWRESWKTTIDPASWQRRISRLVFTGNNKTSWHKGFPVLRGPF